MMQTDNMNPIFPLAFRDVHYMALLYRANSFEVQHHLKNTGLKPALHFFGKPIVAVGLIQYKDSDLGAYHEIILAIPVVLNNDSSNQISNWLDLYAYFEKRRGGQYIIHIPVTSQRSVDGGRDLWGYPKTLEPINHDFRNNKINSCLKDTAGNTVLHWKGSVGIAVPIPSMNLMTYSFLYGSLMKTKVDVKAKMKWFPFADIQLTVANNLSEMARDIKSLGLPGKKPIAVLGTEKFSAWFHAPEKIH
jgi:hypothetical protein